MHSILEEMRNTLNIVPILRVDPDMNLTDQNMQVFNTLLYVIEANIPHGSFCPDNKIELREDLEELLQKELNDYAVWPDDDDDDEYDEWFDHQYSKLYKYLYNTLNKIYTKINQNMIEKGMMNR